MKKFVGFLGVLLRILLTFVLIVLLCAAAVSAPGCRILTDRAMHESIATAPQTLEAQETAIAEGIDKLTAKYSFSPDSLTGILDRAELTQLNLNAVAWWMTLLQSKDELTPPAWTAPDLDPFLEEDALWQEETMASRKDAKKLNKAVSSLVSGTVLPLRTQLITFAAAEVWQRVDLAKFAAWLPYVPTILALVCLLLAGLMCLSRKGVSYVGAACLSAALLQGLLFFLALQFHLLETLAAVSPVLTLQVKALLGRLAPMAVGILAVEVVLGLLLTIRGAYRKEAAA